MSNMPITPRGLKLLLAGVTVMIAGYVLMTGPGPVQEVFNYDMFDWRRLVAAPIVILCGVAVIVAGIMGGREKDKE